MCTGSLVIGVRSSVLELWNRGRTLGCGVGQVKVSLGGPPARFHSKPLPLPCRLWGGAGMGPPSSTSRQGGDDSEPDRTLQPEPRPGGALLERADHPARV